MQLGSFWRQNTQKCTT